ncbi:succinate dehydrogenase, cytochrome b556 subunit [Thioalkalivibrio sp. HK1]|uniref:succinate dehydrogenase, cytochrome b556 subunit n=1 Tax=Thioalkalivibrio sp. HK1 TaxID=1469245 RepID=UPI0004723041|nr:succinate dehydrogenase, cytochrome b556 subunit [Thioalkalivibrio sp. HK1]
MIGRPHRGHAGYWAFLAHRISGLALALFLPLHFLALGLALEGAQKMDSFLAWADSPLLKFAQWLLVLALALHLTGGLRLLMAELWIWSDRQRTWISIASGTAVAVSLVFAFNLGQSA